MKWWILYEHEKNTILQHESNCFQIFEVLFMPNSLVSSWRPRPHQWRGGGRSSLIVSMVHQDDRKCGIKCNYLGMSGITKSQSFCSSSAPFIPLAYFNDQEISGFKGARVAIKILKLQGRSFMTWAHDSLVLEFFVYWLFWECSS